MAQTTLLAIPQIAADQASAYLAANDMVAFLELATQSKLAVDLSGGPVSLTQTEFIRNMIFVCTGHVATETLTIPNEIVLDDLSTNPASRVFMVKNGEGSIVTLSDGTFTYDVEPNATAIIAYDDTGFEAAASGDAATAFIGLSDTPADYSGAASQLVVVNSGGTALEFVDLTVQEDGADDLVNFRTLNFTTGLNVGTGGSTATISVDLSSLQLNDTPGSYGTQGQVLAVNAGADGLEWVDAVSATPVADWKESVRVYISDPGTLATDFEDGDTHDDVTLATGDRITLGGQADATENGVYTVNASGAPTRATDFDDDAEVTSGAVFYVEEGTAHGGKLFILTTTGDITVGSTNLTFSQVVGSGSVTSILELTDTPGSFGIAGQMLIVNPGANALEWATPVTAILDLDDTPGSFGTAGQVLVVNAGGNGLEWANATGATSVLGLTDTPGSYGTAGQVLVVNAGADGLEFADQSGGGGGSGTNAAQWYKDGTHKRHHVTATAAGGSSGDPSQTLRAELTSSFYWDSGSATKSLTFDFGEDVNIAGLAIYQNVSTSQGDWQLSYSDDDSVYTDVGSTFAWGGSTINVYDFPDTDGISARYWRVTLVSGSSSSSPYVQKVAFKIAYDSDGAGGGSSVGAFPDLTDTPADYSGQGGKVVAVTDTEDGLEFVEQTGGDVQVVSSDTVFFAGFTGFTGSANSSGGISIQGGVFQPDYDLDITGIDGLINPTDTADYAGVIIEVTDGTASATVVEVVGTTATQNLATGVRLVRFEFASAVQLSADSYYVVGLYRTDGGTLRSAIESNNGEILMNAPGTTFPLWVRYNDLPSASDSYDGNGVGSCDIGLVGSYTVSDGSVTEIASNALSFIVAAGDETTALTAGTDVVSFRAPYDFKIDKVKASLATASSSGDVAVDINVGGVSIFGSNKLTIDQDATTSVGSATSVELSTTDIADDQVLTIDIDSAGVDAAGLKITIITTSVSSDDNDIEVDVDVQVIPTTLSSGYNIEDDTNVVDAGDNLTLDFSTADFGGWTLEDFVSGTVDVFATDADLADGIYDLTTRPGTLLLQLAGDETGNYSHGLRVEDTLQDGESLVVKFIVPTTYGGSSQALKFGIGQNDLTTVINTTSNNNSGMEFNSPEVSNDVEAYIQATGDSGNMDVAAGLPIYMRMSRVGSTLHYMWSQDGKTWTIQSSVTVDGDWTNMWIFAGVDGAGPESQAVFGIEWIRHVASTSLDLWASNSAGATVTTTVSGGPDTVTASIPDRGVFAPFSPPTLADFSSTVLDGTPVFAESDDSTRGLLMEVTGAAANNDMVGWTKPITKPATGTSTYICRIMAGLRDEISCGYGFGLLNSAEGRSQHIGLDPGSTAGTLLILGHDAGSFNTSVGTSFTDSINDTSDMWFKIELDADESVRFFYSHNGSQWTEYGATTLNTWLESPGGEVDAVGFFIKINDDPQPVRINVPFFSEDGTNSANIDVTTAANTAAVDAAVAAAQAAVGQIYPTFTTPTAAEYTLIESDALQALSFTSELNDVANPPCLEMTMTGDTAGSTRCMLRAELNALDGTEATWRYEVGVIWNLVHQGQGVHGAGLYLTDSDTDIWVYRIIPEAAGDHRLSTVPDLSGSLGDGNLTDTVNGDNPNRADLLQYKGGLWFYALEYDGTDFYWEYSFDGRNWIRLIEMDEASSDLISAVNSIGLFIIPTQTASGPPADTSSKLAVSVFHHSFVST